MSEIPLDHIQDAHKLEADAYLDFYQLTPSGGGSGTIFFKPDNNFIWRGDEYVGLPMALTGEKKSSDQGLTMPKLLIGQENIDLSMFKPLINDGYLDNAVIVRHVVLLANAISNLPISEITTYRVKRVEEYSRTKIQMQLATLSDSLGFSMPYRQYLPPAFPSVQM